MSQDTKRLGGFSLESGPLGSQHQPEIITQAQKLGAAGKYQEGLDLLSPWVAKSPMAARAVQDLQKGIQREHGLSTLPLLSLFGTVSLSGSSRPLPALEKLQENMTQEGSSLRQAFHGLSSEERQAIEQQVGKANLSQFLHISDSTLPEEFWGDLVRFAVEQKSSFEPKQTAVAKEILAYVVSQGAKVPESIFSKAKREHDALMGQGGLGLRLENATGSILHQATDAKMIAPMVLASPVFHLGRAATLRGLLATGSENVLTRGLGARMLAGGVGLTGETAFFSLSSRTLTHFFDGPVAWDANSVLKDFGAAVLTLGLLKGVGFLGRQGMLRIRGLNELNPALWTKVDQQAMFWAGQASGYLGLVTAHYTEEKIGLRPHVEGSNIWADALGTHIALGVGSHLGRQILGQRFAAWEHRLSADTKILTDATRISRTLRGKTSPLDYLKKMWQDMGAAGTNGFPPGMVPAAAGAMGGQMMAIPQGKDALPTHMAMSSLDGPGDGAPGAKPIRTTGGVSRGVHNGKIWLRLKEESHNRHYLRIPEALYPFAEAFSEAAATKPSESPLESMGNFMGEILEAPLGKHFNEGTRRTLLKEVFLQFQKEFVGENDIHAVTRGLTRQRDLVRTYQHAKFQLAAKGEFSPEVWQFRPALVEAMASGKAGIFLQFGGQANSYLGELKDLYETYPEVQALVEKTVRALQRDVASSEARSVGLHGEGFDVMGWIKGSSKMPSESYLASSAVSQPLILLTQLGHYYSNLKSMGLTPREFAKQSKGATGHSQGVMAAVVAAKSRTDGDFVNHTIEAARYLLWQGIRMGEAHPETNINPDVVAAAVEVGDGVPTSMMGILKLSPETVREYVEKANETLSADRQVEVSLVNGPRAVVVSGHPEGLHFLREHLRRDEFDPNNAGGDQGKVPFSERKLELVTNYFPVGAAFHTKHYMGPVPKRLAADIDRLGIKFQPEDLQIPVYNTYDGKDLRESQDLMGDLIRMQSVQPVQWELATSKATPENGVTHLLDFGPGGTAGIGAITARNKTGTGVQVILGGLLGKSSLPDRSYLSDTAPSAVKQAPHWAKDFGPKLVRLADGSLMVDTKFTRALGKPPVMQAGMTPTSANEKFVSAVINSGFHGELAGGGQHNEAYFRERVDQIMARIPAGEGITSNLLFLNAYLWGFQAPLVQLMAKEGKPMDGITVAAGVPSLDNANEVLTQFREAGIRHVAFKPGAVQSIKDVVAIAKANPETTIMLQWTGGRGGGHHSYEDAHAPILETYAAIRKQPNILLVMGSGVGDGKDSLPYMTGEWSEALGFPRMPFDAVLLASRLMVAEEASTAPAVKELLVQAPGVEHEAQWEQSYKKPAGGVVTVESELGAPIHKIHNRGIALWKSFDEKYFSKPAEEAEAAILKDKAKIIEKINADYQKLYFGKKSDGRVADLEEMTYAEVANRMIELMTVSGQGEWIDVTFRDRFFDFVVRTEERMHPSGEDGVALLQSRDQIQSQPQKFMEKFLARYPRAGEQLLATEDVEFFLSLCKRPGKPVNFIPVIDKDLKAWFKKDSLWQSEWLEASPEQDADRVAILQGPVAVKYSTSTEETVGNIMGGINQYFIDQLLAGYESPFKIPRVEYLGGPEIRPVDPEQAFPQVQRQFYTSGEGKVHWDTLPKDQQALPDAKAWLHYLAGAKPSWVQALMATPRVVRGKERVENILPKLFRPRPGQAIQTRTNVSGEVTRIEIHDPMMLELLPREMAKEPVVSASIEGDQIKVRISHPRPASVGQDAKLIHLDLEYRYNPKQGYAPIHEAMPDYNARVKDFYAQLWTQGDAAKLTVDSTFTGEFTLSREHMKQFTRAVGNRQAAFVEAGQEKLQAPMDMAIVAAWKPLVQTLFPEAIDGNIFNLVHGSNGFRLLDTKPLTEGDHMSTAIKITEVKNTDAGILVGVAGRLQRNGQDYADLSSTFLIRGSKMAPEHTFSRKQETRRVELKQAEDIAILRAKDWIKIDEGIKFSCGECLRFEVETTHRYGAGKGLSKTSTEGVIKRNGQVVGRVELSDAEVAGNVAEAYLVRHGEVVGGSQFFESGGYNLLATPDVAQVPGENLSYGKASFDLNPIHYNPYIADLAGHEGTLTHGMWTSANGRRVLEAQVAKNHPERVHSYEAQFVGKVFPGDQLVTQVKHVGMRDGRMVLEVETVNQEGTPVLKAKAEVDRAPEAYVFTGQGSQAPGMGMELYESSKVAQEVWDRADRYMYDKYGFSILEIVRGDPQKDTELTISFGGPKGAEIRKNYMALTQEVVAEEGGQQVRKTVPLFPEITEETESYTFRAPKGLLNATQFTQPALTLVEKAAFEDMKAKGLISTTAPFAGHSLGEYAALSSVADVLSVETLAEVVFLRGMTMQGAVPRDAQGRSPYGMVAVNPKKLGDEGLRQVVAAIAGNNGKLLEVVNYNVEGQQYVVAGDNQSLYILSEVLKPLRNNPKKLAQLDELLGKANAKAETELAKVRKSSGDPGAAIPLKRGSLIPLEGIDVPFHSTVLRDGVPAFRTIIQEKIPNHIDIDRLVGTYVPNLTAKPFSLEREYIQEVYELTESPVLKNTLDNFYPAIASNPQGVGRTLLIELLAYQFASPVRWIETQDLIFGQGAERVVELGPGPVLTAMADRTLKSGKFPSMSKRELLAYASDPDALYFSGGDKGPSAAEHADSTFAEGELVAAEPLAPAPKAEAQAPAPAPAAPVAAPAPAPAAGPAPSDSPIRPLESLQVMLALKLGKPISEISTDKSIKDLVGGQSAKQNEILGDLQKEFGGGPDNSAELKLSELSEAVGSGYSAMGKQTQTLTAKMIRDGMPGGFGMSQVKDYLSTERQLGPGLTESVLVHALTHAPKSRLGSETEAKAWLDQVTDSYGQQIGQALPKASAAAPVAAPAAVAVAAGPAAQPVPDAPVGAVEALKVMLAVKLGKSVSEISPSTTIKDLVGGQSAKQNEILGDLQKEFGGGPDNSAELPLSELGSAVGSAYAGLGKHTQGLTSKMVRDTMPGGFGMAQVREYLAKERLLGDGRIEGVLLHGLTMAPKGRLGSEAEAKSWLDSVADSYGKAQGITVPKGGAAAPAGAGAMVGMPAVDSAEAAAHRKKVDKLIEEQLRVAAQFLGKDPQAAPKLAMMERQLREQAEADLQAWGQEHGEDYFAGIQPIFVSTKSREYNSAWNWARQEVVELFYNFDKLSGVNELAASRMRLINRASPQLLEVVSFYSEMTHQQGEWGRAMFFTELEKDIRAHLGKDPAYEMPGPIPAPQVSVNAEGKIEYGEVPRTGVNDAAAYVKEMAKGNEFQVDRAPVQAEASLRKAIESQGAYYEMLKETGADAKLISAEYSRLQELQGQLAGKQRVPYLFMKSAAPTDPNAHVYDKASTQDLFNSMAEMATHGLSLKGKTVLVTGASPGSIGIETVKAQLAAGAKVIVTTSNFSKRRTDYYQKLYQDYGAEGSELVVLPFNQASVQDVKALVDYIYDPAKGLGRDLDFVIPFAGISEQGMDIGNIGDRSELAHRIMLTNTIRLIGEVKNQKESRGIVTKPAHVIMPLSPNHGLFGFDGLYAESKLGLEAMMNKWSSEGWNKYLSVGGAVIGWTRGTNLMEGNDLATPAIEAKGARTFSQREMAFNLMALMHPRMVKRAQREPLWADFNGGFQMLDKLSGTMAEIRRDLDLQSRGKRAAHLDALEDSTVRGEKTEEAKKVAARENFDFAFPALPSKDRLEALKDLQGMVNLEKVVVVAGFGEVSPWGNARTRWEMEAKGEFSVEGALEMAWIMGFVDFHRGPLGKDRNFVGWIDAETKEPLTAAMIKERYEEKILAHSGIREVEPELFEGYDPHKKEFFRGYVFNEDMKPRAMDSKEDAESFKRRHGDAVDIYEQDGTWYADFKQGATIFIPRAIDFDRFVAGQIPSGWDPARYGVPENIIRQTDPTTLYLLVSTVEALVSAGVTDPYEFYEYVHVSELGNTQGGGMGGMRSIRRGFRERAFEKDVQGDILQEQLINVMPAWINMLLLSSSGPIKTPVGACATAAESVDIGVDTIQSGKAKVVFVGGYDDFSEEGTYEFAQMQATSSSRDQISGQGRDPREHSRPSTSSRGGFMESQGAGAQILMSADLAIKMGVPIYGIVALSNTASDKQGESVPAPGQGILTTARETKGAWRHNPMMDLGFRSKQLYQQRAQNHEWEKGQIRWAEAKADQIREQEGDAAAEDFLSVQKNYIAAQAARMEKAALDYWGNEFFKGDPSISPLRGALGVWGLTPDDIEISSFHGTSTAANDRNESEVNHKQMKHLERTPGNPLLTIWQKNLTGHPKGAAAAWMFNGVMQSMLSGVVPGNRNADNIDPEFRAYNHLLYPNRSIDYNRPLKAGLLKSFGFGQAGAEVLVIHPDYLLASLDPKLLEGYAAKRAKREQQQYRYWHNTLTGVHPFFTPKTHPPYSASNETSVYLNPLARAKFDPAKGTWMFPEVVAKKTKATPPDSSTPPPSSRPGPANDNGGGNGRYGQTPKVSSEQRVEGALRKQMEGLKGPEDKGIGIDANNVSDFKKSLESEGFIPRNFTSGEIEYCSQSANPNHAFAGRWAAKEAVIKAISDSSPNAAKLWKSSGAAVKDIEIVKAQSESPEVVLHGHAKKVAQSLGITSIKVSISHDGDMATASAVAR